MLVRVYNPSTGDAETGGSQELHGKKKKKLDSE